MNDEIFKYYLEILNSYEAKTYFQSLYNLIKIIVFLII